MGTLRRLWGWLDDRTGISGAIVPLAKHRVPPKTGWWYVFGSATLFAFLLQVVTGIILATLYVPSTEHAYDSLQNISQHVLLGNWLRGIHYFGASAMIVLLGIHLARVFLTGSFKFPREMNWLTGVVLLALTLAAGFTGQILRWDQDAVWSTVVGAEQAGRMPVIGTLLAQFLMAGETIGAATLSRFFSFHVILFPLLLFGVIGVHLALVIRNGISEPPGLSDKVDPKTYRQRYQAMLARVGRPFWPDVAWRDAVFGAAVVLLVVVLAFIFGPRALGAPPDPTNVQAYPRPDWWLVWYFAVLALLPHGSESAVIILAPLVAFLALLLVPILGNKGERSPARRPWAVAFVTAAFGVVGGLTVLGFQSPWVPVMAPQNLPETVVASSDPQVVSGAALFNAKGCESCHTVSGFGGNRGPDLTLVGDRLSAQQMRVYITNGANNMPSYLNNMTPQELNAIMAFLQTRTAEHLAQAKPTPKAGK